MEYLETLSPNLFWDVHPIGVHSQNWLGGFAGFSAPIDLPLWYLRDLIVLVLLAPAIWFLINKTKGWVLMLLLIAYISRIWFIIPGFGITGLFFFSIGAFLGMRQIDITKMAANKFGWVLIPTIFLAAMAVYFRGTYTVIGQNIMPFYVITAVISALFIAGRLVKRGCQPNSFLVKSCFFVFACHEVIVWDIAKIIVEKAFRSDFVWPLQYVMMVVIILFICLSLYYIILKYFPGLSKVLAGNK